MAYQIMSVDARDKLKARKAIYWYRISTGYQLGYRKMTSGSVGTWFAQAYDPATRKQLRQGLGALDHLPAYQRYDAAKKLAEAWFEHLGRGGSTKVITVSMACEQYVENVRAAGAEKNARDLEARFRRRINNDPLGKLELPKLTRSHVEAWRRRLVNAPVRFGKDSAVATSGIRSGSSVNRDMTALRAALNRALDHRFVTSDDAWRVPLRPLPNADGRRDVYLSITERQALVAQSPPDLADFLKGMSLLPLRPGALAALMVSNFDQNLRVLRVGKDKSGRDRQLKLPLQTGKFFSSLAAGKTPSCGLFLRESGKSWDKDAWKKPIKLAANAAGLPNTVTVYVLRHSVITDLVTGIAGSKPLDLLTIAHLSGTSVAMIEKHYGHLRAEHAEQALAALQI